MKLCVHVLLLALGVISGHKCDEASESATETIKGTKGSYLISEFQPNPTGLLQDTHRVELSGPPNTAFEGCIWSVEADGLPMEKESDWLVLWYIFFGFPIFLG